MARWSKGRFNQVDERASIEEADYSERWEFLVEVAKSLNGL